MSIYLQAPAADVGTASQPTASGRDAATKVPGTERKGRQSEWAQRRREELQRGGRWQQRAGRGAATRRKMGRECGRAVQRAVEMAASSVAAAAVETAAAAAAAAVARAVSVAEREVRQVAVWAAVLRGEVGMMEEQLAAANGMAVGVYTRWVRAEVGVSEQ